MTEDCEIYEQSAQPTLSVRTRASVQDLPQLLGETYAAIGQLMKKLGVEPCGMPYTAYYNQDMQDLEVEIGFPINQNFSGEGVIQSGEMPAGKYASVLHRGPYSELRTAYDTLGAFIEKEGYIPTGVAYEFYQNAPDEVSPKDLETRIVFPIQTKT